MATLFALFAEVERDLISERTREGLAPAKASQSRSLALGGPGSGTLRGAAWDADRAARITIAREMGHCSWDKFGHAEPSRVVVARYLGG